MKPLFRLVQTAVLSVVSAASVFAQPQFQNLGFESAVFVPIPGGPGDPFLRVQFGPAFRGWVGYLNDVPQTVALRDTLYLSGRAIGLVSTGAGRIQGGLTAVLQPYTFDDASLAQTGLVGVNTKSLLFYAIPRADPDGYRVGPPDGSFGVSLGGQPLQLFNLGTGPNNSIFYGADVRAWAGQTTELRFTAFATGLHNNLFLDGIQFSALPVPEPSVLALAAIGGLVLLLRQRRRLAKEKPHLTLWKPPGTGTSTTSK